MQLKLQTALAFDQAVFPLSNRFFEMAFEVATTFHFDRYIIVFIAIIYELGIKENGAKGNDIGIGMYARPSNK